MAIDYRVDHDRRLVLVEGRGTVSGDELSRYQREVWSRADVAGYNELADMSAVERFDHPSVEGMRGLAELSAGMDSATGGGKFAIVAPQDVAYGLGRMYETYRAMNQRSTKRVVVFRDRAEAVKWLVDIE